MQRDAKTDNSNHTQDGENGDINGTLSSPKVMEERSNDNEKEGNQGNQEYTMEEEWAIVGKTCDHCLFAIFMVVFIIGTISCFANVKYTH